MDELPIGHLADNINRSGVAKVFGIPGGGASLELIDGLINKDINFYTTHFEASAAIMAGTIGRLTGKAGLAVSIKGPGIANMVPGLAVCFLESYPLVAICESYHGNASISKVHKRMDHALLTKEVVKSCRYLSDNLESYNSAARYAESEIPGPVLLNLAEGSDGLDVKGKKEVETAEMDDRFYNNLDDSQKPIVIAGSLAIRQGWSDLLSKLNIPVFTTASAKGLIDETLPHAAGVYSGVGQGMVTENSLIPDADLVIGLGLRNTEVLAAKAFPCHAINIEMKDENLISGFDFNYGLFLHQASDVFERLLSKSWGRSEIYELRKTMINHLTNQGFLPARILDILAGHFNRKVRLVVDTGYFCTIAEHIWLSEKSDMFLCAGNSRYMGTAIPMALGAAFHDPSVPIVAAVGDGGIGMYLADLKLAVSNKLPLMVLLFSDGRYGSICARAIEKNLDLAPLKITEPSWLKVLEGMGMESIRAKNSESFHEAISQWEPNSGPIFIECIFEPELYQEMVKGIRH